MLATRLVLLIETHADRLSSGLIEKLKDDPRCCDLYKVPEHEMKARSYEIYHNLNEWLLGSREQRLEKLYREIGARRAHQNVAFSHVLCAMNATKEQLWQFLQDEGVVTKPMEIFGEMELFLLLERFFDKAIYYMSVGYEHSQKSHSAAA